MPFGLGQPSAAGSGLEVINVEVASFRLGLPEAVWRIQLSVEVASCRPEPPAAGSGLEALNVVGFRALRGRLAFRFLDLGFWFLEF